MWKPGLIAGSLALPLLLGACGIFGGVSSTGKSLSGAADSNKGSYNQPLAVPPNYELRPPPARAEKKAEPTPEPENTEKKPQQLDTEPVTATKTEAPARSVPASTRRDTPPATRRQPETRNRNPQPLVIQTPDAPKADPEARRAAPAQREVRRQVPAPPQPSETTGNVQPETRGSETTRSGDPTSGEDELLKRSGVKE